MLFGVIERLRRHKITEPHIVQINSTPLHSQKDAFRDKKTFRKAVVLRSLQSVITTVENVGQARHGLVKSTPIKGMAADYWLAPSVETGFLFMLMQKFQEIVRRGKGLCRDEAMAGRSFPDRSGKRPCLGRKRLVIVFGPDRRSLKKLAR